MGNSLDKHSITVSLLHSKGKTHFLFCAHSYLSYLCKISRKYPIVKQALFLDSHEMTQRLEKASLTGIHELERTHLSSCRTLLCSLSLAAFSSSLSALFKLRLQTDCNVSLFHIYELIKPLKKLTKNRLPLGHPGKSLWLIKCL